MSGSRKALDDEGMRADGALVWAVHRQPEDHPDVELIESIRKESDGLFYLREASELLQATFPDLRMGPHGDVGAVGAAHPELLLIRDGDVVITCKLSNEDVLKHVDIDDMDVGVDVELGERSFHFIGFLFPGEPDISDSLAVWSLGDDYDYPGGDREIHLYRVGTVSVVWDDRCGWEIFGHHESDQQAFEQWGDFKIPGGLLHCNGKLAFDRSLSLPC